MCGEIDQFLDQLVGSGFKSHQRTIENQQGINGHMDWAIEF